VIAMKAMRARERMRMRLFYCNTTYSVMV
jgi:hypothetical protein